MSMCFGTKNIEKLYMGSKEVEGISVGDEPAWTPGGGSQWLCFTALENGCSLAFYFYDEYAADTKLWVSRDKQTWTEYPVRGSQEEWEFLSLDRYEKVFFKGKAPTKFYYPRFYGSGSMAVSGNPMTMIDEDGTLTDNWTRFPTGGGQYNFQNMFDYMTALTYAHGLTLSATTLTEGCYMQMFYNCSSLVSAPKNLPAMTATSQCYKSMFEGCTSLVNAPQLPATTLANQCYCNMFYGCTALASPPSVLPAETMANICYNGMFTGCQSLALTPKIMAKTAAYYSCERMFNGCTSIIHGPEMAVETVAEGCFSYMFGGCIRMRDAYDLPATTLAYQCYYGMFYNCEALTEAPAIAATTLAASCFESMFEECSGLETVSAMNAEVMEASCCKNMYAFCTSLAQLPALCVTAIAANCFQSMFEGCTAIGLNDEETRTYYYYFCIPDDGSVAPATNATLDMFKDTGGIVTGTPSINTTYFAMNEVVYPEE